MIGDCTLTINSIKISFIYLFIPIVATSFKAKSSLVKQVKTNFPTFNHLFLKVYKNILSIPLRYISHILKSAISIFFKTNIPVMIPVCCSYLCIRSLLCLSSEVQNLYGDTHISAIFDIIPDSMSHLPASIFLFNIYIYVEKERQVHDQIVRWENRDSPLTTH